jgi:hypothetical protein
VVNILLIWFHPPAISTTLVVIAAILNLFIWVLTATVAIPIHKQLDREKSIKLIDRLVKVHLYMRIITGSLVMIVTALMMYQALSANSVARTEIRFGCPDTRRNFRRLA